MVGLLAVRAKWLNMSWVGSAVGWLATSSPRRLCCRRRAARGGLSTCTGCPRARRRVLYTDQTAWCNACSGAQGASTTTSPPAGSVTPKLCTVKKEPAPLAFPSPLWLSNRISQWLSLKSYQRIELLTSLNGPVILFDYSTVVEPQSSTGSDNARQLITTRDRLSSSGRAPIPIHAFDSCSALPLDFVRCRTSYA